MSTIWKSLRQISEVAKPVPKDEQDFVAAHGMKISDLEANPMFGDGISPYGQILKNLAAIKPPGSPSRDKHGHDTEEKSKQAYQGPKSTAQKTAELAAMMEATIDPKEQQLAAGLKNLLADSFDLYLQAHHFHWNVMGPDFAQYHDFLGELYQEVHNAVDMIAENIRVLGELVGTINSPAAGVGVPLTAPGVMVVELLAKNKQVINSLTSCYRLAESMGRLGISNFLQDRLTAHEKHHWMLQSMAGIKGEDPVQESKEVTGIVLHFKHPDDKVHTSVHFTPKDANAEKEHQKSLGNKHIKTTAQYATEEADPRTLKVGQILAKLGRRGQPASKMHIIDNP